MKLNKSKYFSKEDLITGGVIAICLLVYAIFPTENGNVFQKIVSMLTFLFVIPVLYVKIILKKDLKDLGLQVGNKKNGILYSLIGLLFSFLVVIILVQYFSFLEKYTLNEIIRIKFLFFIIYEIILVGLFVFLYEFFFRGFVQFSFSEKMGIRVVFIQAVLFFLLFWTTKTLNWSMAPFIVTSLFSGYTALKSRSIWYSFLATWIFIVIIDAFVIKSVK